MSKEKIPIYVKERGNYGDKIYYNGKFFHVLAAVFSDDTPMVNGAFLPQGGSKKAIDNIRIKINGRVFCVGNLAAGALSYRSPVGMTRYAHDDYALPLTHGGFAASGASGPIAVITGLPIDDWSNEKNKRTVINHFMGEHLVTIPQKRGKDKIQTVIVKSVDLMPETLGTYYDLLINDQGDFDASLAAKRIVLMDIGRYSACIVTVDGGKFDNVYSRSTPYGIQHVLNRFETKVFQATEYRIPAQKIRGVFDSGILALQGDEIDVSAQREQALGDTVNLFLNEATNTLQDARGVNLIALCGGVAPLFAPGVKKIYQHSELVANPVMSNCQGMAKWGKAKHGG